MAACAAGSSSGMKGLKQRPPTQEASVTQPEQSGRPGLEELVRIVGNAAGHLPSTSPPPQQPAAVEPGSAETSGKAKTSSNAGNSAMLNVRLQLATLDALANKARTLGITQKALVVQALKQIGVDVDATDLEDRSRRRRPRE